MGADRHDLAPRVVKQMGRVSVTSSSRRQHHLATTSSQRGPPEAGTRITGGGTQHSPHLPHQLPPAPSSSSTPSLHLPQPQFGPPSSSASTLHQHHTATPPQHHPRRRQFIAQHHQPSSSHRQAVKPSSCQSNNSGDKHGTIVQKQWRQCNAQCSVVPSWRAKQW